MHWYTGDSTYDTVLTIGLACALLVPIGSHFVPSSYGRFSSERFGPRINARLGWFIMELPATVGFLWFYLLGPHRGDWVPLVLLALWLIHYANRGFLFPLLMRTPRGERSTFSMFIVGAGWLVTGLHSYLHGSFFTRFATHYTAAWLRDPRFLFGLALFLACEALNIQSDAIIRNLRTPSEVAAGIKTYRIPRGGLYRWVTNANYLTEIGLWTGYALATWSLASLFILLVSIGNLVPRAWSTQQWYRARFPDYPSERKVLVPFLF